MSINLVSFYFFAFITVASAINILITKNLLHAAFSLLGTFIGVAAIFVFAGADFMAITQVMIYVGGILVLLLFGIMLTRKKSGDGYMMIGNQNRILGLGMSIFIFIFLVTYFLKVNFESKTWIVSGKKTNHIILGSTITTIGKNLMTNYILPFEVAGFILLVALMGAALIAHKAELKK